MTRDAELAIESIRRLIAEGAIAEAAHLCEQRLRGADVQSEAHILQGLLLSITGRTNEAITAYEAALAAAPNALSAYIGLADIFAGKGWLASAITVMETADQAVGLTASAQSRLEALQGRLRNSSSGISA